MSSSNKSPTGDRSRTSRSATTLPASTTGLGPNQLDPIENGTRLTIRISDPGGDEWAQIGTEFSASVDDQAGQFEALLAELSGAGMLE